VPTAGRSLASHVAQHRPTSLAAARSRQQAGPACHPLPPPSPTRTPPVPSPSLPRARLPSMACTPRLASGLYKPPPHPLGPSTQTLATTELLRTAAAAFYPPRRHLSAVEEHLGSFARSRASRGHCWLASPVLAALARPRWRFATAAARLFELRVVVFVGESPVMP
jgi:hypothetical protein